MLTSVSRCRGGAAGPSRFRPNRGRSDRGGVSHICATNSLMIRAAPSASSRPGQHRIHQPPAQPRVAGGLALPRVDPDACLRARRRASAGQRPAGGREIVRCRLGSRHGLSGHWLTSACAFSDQASEETWRDRSGRREAASRAVGRGGRTRVQRPQRPAVEPLRPAEGCSARGRL
jgi:hypothetical protein